MSARARKAQPPRLRRRGILRTIALAAIAVVVVLPVVMIAIYGIVPPPITPLMIIRSIEGEGLTKDWVGLDAISPHLPAAVIASEDNKFCSHSGFDWDQIEKAVETYGDGGRPRGASTISMQTAKNLFLWPGRSFVRKGLESYLAMLLEIFWTKQRILEVYLNIVEWSGGVYGAEAAARHYFGKHAADISQREAALLATVLPNPLHRSASNPTGEQLQQADTLITRIGQIRPLLNCY